MRYLCPIHVVLLFLIVFDLFNYLLTYVFTNIFNYLNITYHSYLMINLSFLFIHNTDLRGSESVAVTPQFVSPIWELVSERNNSDDVNMEEGNGEDGVGASETGGRVRKEGEGGQKGEGEERKGERKGNSKEEKGRRGQGRDSTHTQSLPSASYAQSFQGF